MEFAGVCGREAKEEERASRASLSSRFKERRRVAIEAESSHAGVGADNGAVCNLRIGLERDFGKDFGMGRQLQGVGNDDQKVLILAATNTPYALDQAVRRRFDKRIYIPLPDLKARQHMFKVHLGDTPHSLTESDFESLARRTEGFSGSDISVCVKDVLFEPVRKTQDAMFFTKTPDGMWIPCGPKTSGAVQTTMQELAAKGLAAKILPPPITRTDFDKVLARQRPTVSKADLELHERFTKEFGEEG